MWQLHSTRKGLPFLWIYLHKIYSFIHARFFVYAVISLLSVLLLPISYIASGYLAKFIGI
ncbi:hypothetical protein BSM4216_2135 [Bacillus smithii]|nr:hypothetical protein BSM4216_2135 [Bacillus smithii]